MNVMKWMLDLIPDEFKILSDEKVSHPIVEILTTKRCRPNSVSSPLRPGDAAVAADDANACACVVVEPFDIPALRTSFLMRF